MEPKELEQEQEQQQSESGQKPVVDGSYYIEALKEMKNKTVSREAYEKLEGEHKELLAAYLDGKEIDIPTPEQKPDIAKLRKELYTENCNLSNLEYWEKTLALRKAIMDDGGVDPFLPYGSKIVPEQNDIEKAEKVARIVQEAIEYADGDSEVFTNELQRIMVDVPIPKRPR